MRNTTDILIEALPYFQQFSGKTIVVKLGGSILDDFDLRKKIIEDIVLLKTVGIKVVLVHGGGRYISSLMKRLGKESKFINGLRVTDQETVDVSEMVMAGLISKNLVSLITKLGEKAVGISGKDGRLIQAEKIKKTKKVDYGQVGSIKKVNIDLIKTLENNGYIPVISPITADNEGNSLNINADTVAMEVAIGLQAEKLIFLSDIDGLFRDINDSSSLIREVKTKQAMSLIRQKVIQGGMVPKIQSCVSAIKQGVNSLHILNGKKKHAILLELFTDLGVGTQIVK